MRLLELAKQKDLLVPSCSSTTTIPGSRTYLDTLLSEGGRQRGRDGLRVLNRRRGGDGGSGGGLGRGRHVLLIGSGGGEWEGGGGRWNWLGVGGLDGSTFGEQWR